MLHIEYQISEDDYVAAAKLGMQRRSKSAKAWLYGIPLLGAVVFVYGVSQLFIQHQWSSVLVIAWGAFLLGLPFGFIRSFHKQYRKNTNLHKPRCLEVDDFDLHFISPNADSRVSWDAFSAFADNDKCFVLFQQGNSTFMPIPKRQLSPEQVDQLRNLLAAHLPQK